MVHMLIPKHLGVSVNEKGCRVIFLICSASSLAGAPMFANMEHREDVIVEGEAGPLSALRISFAGGENSGRAAAYIAFELYSRLIASNLTLGAAELLKSAAWLLELLGAQTLLSFEQQRGLIGELELLRLLLLQSLDDGLAPRTAVERWLGPDRTKRDFAAAGIAIEVKTTSQPTRVHTIGGLDQLEPHAEGEDVFLFSVGIASDRSSPRKLPVFISDVGALLRDDDAAVALFNARLETCGYDARRRSAYEALPGYRPFHLPPALFSCVHLDGLKLTSFKNDSLPAMVGREISWPLVVKSAAMTADEARAVFRRLLAAAPLNAGT
jgi:hypothetical protein